MFAAARSSAARWPATAGPAAGLTFGSAHGSVRWPARRGYAQDYRIKRVLRLPQERMLGVVGDVARYHEFVPYCSESTVVAHGPDGAPQHARLRIGWGKLDEQFLSRLEYSRDSVRATAADNAMFKELLCEWTVRALPGGQCMALLNLRFQFQNRLYDYVSQSAGALVSKKMIEAFSARALALHAEDERKA